MTAIFNNEIQAQELLAALAEIQASLRSMNEEIARLEAENEASANWHMNRCSLVISDLDKVIEGHRLAVEQEAQLTSQSDGYTQRWRKRLAPPGTTPATLPGSSSNTTSTAIWFSEA